MSLRKALLIFVAILIIIAMMVFLLSGNKSRIQKNEKINVTASNFATYDFLRAIIGNNEDVKLELLLGPGKDAHSYEPTAQDLIKIQNSNLFVYIGGEAEKWSDKVMESLDANNTKVVRISDYVDKIKEEEIDGSEEEQEENDEEGSFDDHIWTSPKNAIKMVDTLEKELEIIDDNDKETYRQNAENYINKINEVDSEIREIVDNKVRNRLVFGDRMPMQYFVKYYDLEVSAAFSGCSTETEPSASTIAYLENKVKQDKIPVVFYIELNNGRVAKTIASETGAEALQIQTLHNVSLDDFNNGETWVSLMKKNEEVLKKALQ